MPKIIVRPEETTDEILRRFKREVLKSGNLTISRKKQYYIKPSTARKNRRNRVLSR